MHKSRVISGLPVYNGEKFIAAAIESHLAQSFGDFELVISDNGSTDSTAEICAAYADKDPRITLLRSPENRGILWNHRRVMEAISGPEQYFRWAGADDILEPGLFEKMVAVLDTRPEVACVVPDTRNIDENGQIIGSMPRSLDLQSASVYQRAHDVLVATYQHVIAYGLLRASTLKQMRTGPHYPGWDAVFTWEFALRGQMVQTEGTYLLRRFHPGSISRVKTAKELRRWVEPNAKVGLNFPHWTWTYEHVRTLIATPMAARERLRIAKFLARVTVWQRGNLIRDVTQAARRSVGLSDEYTF